MRTLLLLLVLGCRRDPPAPKQPAPFGSHEACLERCHEECGKEIKSHAISCETSCGTQCRPQLWMHYTLDAGVPDGPPSGEPYLLWAPCRDLTSVNPRCPLPFYARDAGYQLWSDPGTADPQFPPVVVPPSDAGVPDAPDR